MNIKHLFVYGTLQTGMRNAHARALTNKSLAAIPAWLNGADLYDLGEHPGAVRSKSRTAKIQGEILVFDQVILDGLLDALDQYEEFTRGDEHGSLFIRRAENVQTANGSIRAWVYWYNGSVEAAVPIRSGAYAKPLGTRKPKGRRAA